MRLVAWLGAPALVVFVSGVVPSDVPRESRRYCDAVEPGGGSIDGSFLRPYVRDARQIVTDASGTVVNARARWRDELRETTGDGAAVMQRIVTMFRYDGTVYAADTVYFARNSLAPLSNVEWVAGTLVWRREYVAGGLGVTGQRLVAAQGSGVGSAPDSSRQLNIRLRVPVFDFYGGMDAIVAAAIPHRSGEVACIRVYAPSGDTTATLALRVLRHEPVEAGRGRFADAWVVEAPGLNGPMRLWVSKAPPFVFKSEEVALRDGRPWRIYTTLMLD